jgi:hypothetical protein
VPFTGGAVSGIGAPGTALGDAPSGAGATCTEFTVAAAEVSTGGSIGTGTAVVVLGATGSWAKSELAE